jgi:hypothetical protein
MVGMAQGIMPLTVTISISGTMRTTQDHRRLPMSHPLLPSLESRLRNPNPISPNPVYPATYNGTFKNSGRLVNLFPSGGLLN